MKEHVLNTYAREDLDLKDSARLGFAKKKGAEDKKRTRVQHKQSVIMALKEQRPCRQHEPNGNMASSTDFVVITSLADLPGVKAGQYSVVKAAVCLSSAMHMDLVASTTRLRSG